MSPAPRLATPARSILAVLALLMAGCSSDAPEADAPEPRGRSVDGWVLDHILRPLEGATVRLVGVQAEAAVDEGGYWRMDLPDLAGYTFEARAEGHQGQSRTLVFESEGQHKRLNFSLSPEVSREKRVQVHQFDGFIECSAFAVGHEQGAAAGDADGGLEAAEPGQHRRRRGGRLARIQRRRLRADRRCGRRRAPRTAREIGRRRRHRRVRVCARARPCMCVCVRARVRARVRAHVYASAKTKVCVCAKRKS